LKLRLGIFDSGIGGFSVMNALLSSRNDVEVIYLADNERNPYGNKEIKEIRLIASQISAWFADKNLDALLIACNTTNSCALDILRGNLQIPCFDLITSVSGIITSKKIGVLATKATVESSFYKTAIESRQMGIKVFQQSCQDFVAEIEKLPTDFNRIIKLADIYLDPLLKESVEEIILGCSHYPLIYDVLRKKIPMKIRIIDPSLPLVENLNNFFMTKRKNLIKANYANVEFFATGNIDEFSQKVTNWLEINKKISLVSLRT
tara:strand:+ start:3682 stop:4467 length:786 start_codon:yes stop_codon:yes gene_type:complete